jgi:PAS domain S-box-containing protein
MSDENTKGTSIGVRPEDQTVKGKELLEASEARYKAVFDSINDVIFIHDPDTGAISDVNGKVIEMFGYTVDEARTITLEDISSGTPPYTREGMADRIRVAAGKRGAIFEWHCKDKSGRLFWVEISLKHAVINDKDCIVADVRDITEKKLLALERERHVNELQEALAKVKLLSGLLTICSHCKKIRDDKGYWNKLESYISKHSDAFFSHGICPECFDQFYSDLYKNEE